MQKKDNIRWQPFIGKEIVVENSTNKSYENMEGTIVDETKFSFIVKTKSSTKTILKKNSVFGIENTTITGNSIIGRCDQRLKNKK